MEAKGDAVFRVFYGARNVNMDVTFDALLHCCKGTVLDIPGSNADQDQMFSDPMVGVVKHVSIQENDQTRVFEPNQPVRYTCAVNGELLRYANLLQDKRMDGSDFAMQLVTSMYAQSDGFLLKIGTKFGVPEVVVASNHIRATVLEADYNRALLFAGKLKSRSPVAVRPCALAYLPVILSNNHLESLDAAQTALHPGHNQTVTLHSGPNSVQQQPTEQTNMLPSLFGKDEIGLQRRTIMELEEVQSHPFDTLVFDSQRSLEFLLRQAAPMVLRNALTVIVAVKIPAHAAFGNYVQAQMPRFNFYLHKTFYYRNHLEFVVWKRRA